MKTIVFTEDQFEEMLSVLDVNLFDISARDILNLVELTPLTRNWILDIAERQQNVSHKTLVNMLRIESEDALKALMEENK